MKRISYVLAATLFVGCPGTENIDSGIDASAAVDTRAPFSDPRVITTDTAIDAPLACGQLSALCCEGETCNEGICVVAGPSAGRCEIDGCGIAGGPCCVAGSACGTGLSCSDGLCDDATCGAAGQPCCGSDCDNTGDQLFCIGGSCFDCGAVGEACCANALPCLGTLSCVAGTCATPVCGMPGMPCCAGNTCSGAFECVRGEFNICTDTSACGHLDQACCGVGTGCVGSAPPGIECRFDTCRACGAAGQSCCNTGPGVPTRCAAGSTCGGGNICG